MIEKFNFYDVYGYFVPGAAFLAILWIPFGLVRHTWPPSTWTDAIVAAVLAYIVGHLLQSVATNAVPASRLTTKSGQIRNFSETYPRWCGALDRHHVLQRPARSSQLIPRRNN